MIKLAQLVFDYTVIVFGGRILFILFFYSSYNPPVFGFSTLSKRNIAFQIDICIVLLLKFLLLLSINLLDISVPEIESLSHPSYFFNLDGLIIIAMIYSIYSISLELTKGNTLGKKFMGIELRDHKLIKETRTKIIIGRNLLKFLMLIIFILSYHYTFFHLLKSEKVSSLLLSIGFIKTSLFIAIISRYIKLVVSLIPPILTLYFAYKDPKRRLIHDNILGSFFTDKNYTHNS